MQTENQAILIRMEHVSAEHKMVLLWPAMAYRIIYVPPTRYPDGETKKEVSTSSANENAKSLLANYHYTFLVSYLYFEHIIC